MKTDRHWHCRQVAPAIVPGQPILGRCEYIVRGKRLNHYAGSFEIVWFDEPEVDNSAYLLWAAAHSPLAPKSAAEQIEQMCAWHPPTTSIDGTVNRGPVSISLGFAVD